MYIEKDGKKIPNYNAAIVDFYASQDNRDEKNKYIAEEDESNLKGYGTTQKSREYRYERYLKSKNIKVDVIQQERALFEEEGNNIKATVENYEKYKEQGEVLVRDNAGTVFYTMDGQALPPTRGGHIVTITGITDDGWFIVSSWGKQLKLNPEEVINDGSIEVVKYYE